MGGEKRVRMALKGDLTVARCAALQRTILAHLGKYRELDIVLDEAPRIDTAGLQLLVALFREMRQAGADCRLLAMPATVDEFARQAGINLKRLL